jgi:hypothetical protein
MDTDYKMHVLTKNLTAALTAFGHALEKKGVLTWQEISEAMQERLTRMLVDQQEPEEELFLLRALAMAFHKGRSE